MVSEWQDNGSVLLPPATIKDEVVVGSPGGEWGGPPIDRQWFEKLPVGEWELPERERVPGSER